jgi:hypothetical protein
MNEPKKYTLTSHYTIATKNSFLRAVSYTSTHPQLSMSHLDEEEDALEGGTMSGRLSPGRVATFV